MTEPSHTLEMLRARAKELGYVLVHQDRIRTAGAITTTLRKDYGFRMPHDAPDRYIRRAIASELAHFFVAHDTLDIRVSPQVDFVEYDARLTIIGPRAPHPDSMEYYFSAPLQR